MPREIGSWSLNKLKILQLYLSGYLQATTKARRRVYVDAFAGPGYNRLRETSILVDGSPLIGLDARASQNPGLRFDRLYFIEQDDEAADELTVALTQRDPEGRAEVIRGDVNRMLPQVVAMENPRTPVFIFSDTAGIEPKWRTIEAIAPWRTELLINFPLGMSINRNPDSAKAADFFGTAEWQSIWRRGSERELIDFYKGRLKELGYEHTTRDDRLIKSSGGQRLYYLLLVSKVPGAANIMNWVLDQPDALGQTRMRF